MADPAPPDDAFSCATTALALLAVDPAGLGGMVLRARTGPVRDALVAMLVSLPLPAVRLHPAVDDEALFGGLDLSATLGAGRIVRSAGLLADPAALVLTMAERTAPHLAARLAGALDTGGHCLIALDEGADDDEGLPPTLAARLAFRIDLQDTALGEVTGFPPDAEDLAAARARLPHVTTPPDAIAAIVTVAARLGIDSARAALLALRAARAHAALDGQDTVGDADLRIACALVLAHRATQVPTEPENAEEDDGTPEDAPEDADTPSQEDDALALPQEILLEAVRAMLPPDLLARIAATEARRGSGSGTGARVRGNRRGRPLPSRAGRLGGGARIDIVATLRAAAPWQTIRAQARLADAARGDKSTPNDNEAPATAARAALPGAAKVAARDTRKGEPATGETPPARPEAQVHAAASRSSLHIRSADIRTRRFEDRSDRLLIFAVDASGSAALARLAEAKGAVELLLAQAYARRDHVALVAFRGTGAEVLLPPTRSLVQTKRRLAGLPGGGGTPLAAGLMAAMELAAIARRRGLTPTVALLTDGRANVAIDGTADRAKAATDALAVARALRSSGTDALVIDTGNRPEPALRTLSHTLGAPYLPLPRADARALSASVAAALRD